MSLTLVFWVTGVLFFVAALASVYRIVRGPSILDRIIASDVLLTTLICVLGVDMVESHSTRAIPIMIVLALTAVFGSITVARYVSRQDPS